MRARGKYRAAFTWCLGLVLGFASWLAGSRSQAQLALADVSLRRPDAAVRSVALATLDDSASVPLVAAPGSVTLKGLDVLSSMMGCASSDPTCRAHPRLALLLFEISEHFGGRPIHLVSGIREARRYTSKSSRHTKGRAADIQVEGVSERAVWNYCRTLRQTGCGYYPNSVFVHVDVRDQDAQWVDWSRPGMRPRYGTLARPYTQTEESSLDRPRVGRKVTRPDELALTVRVVDKQGQVIELVDEQPQAASLAGLAEELLQSTSPLWLAEAAEAAAVATDEGSGDGSLLAASFDSVAPGEGLGPPRGSVLGGALMKAPAAAARKVTSRTGGSVSSLVSRAAFHLDAPTP